MIPRLTVHRICRCTTVFQHSRNSSTVNFREVSHFDNLATTWWDPNGSSRLLHRMNPLRLSFIKSVLSLESPTTSKFLKDYSILDVGCGGGILTESLARVGAKVEGIDASPRAIQVAKSHARSDPGFIQDNIPTYTCGSIHDHKSKEAYDIVTAMEVLEHVDYPSVFLDELVTKVKPGGWLILSTIARTYAAWTGSILLAERVLGIVPVGTHQWEKFIREEELREYFGKLRNEKGMPWTKEIRVEWCGFNPLKGEWFFTKAKTPRVFNYFIAIRKTT